MAKVRIKDAEVLLRGKRYDGAAYLCGYAIEMMLKARICKTLKWAHFKAEQRGYAFLKTHDLEFLLDISGIGYKIKTVAHFADWSAVNFWKPEVIRYQPTKNQVPAPTAVNMIASAKKLMRVL